MKINELVRNVFFFLLEYFLFLKDEILSKKSKPIKATKHSKINFANVIRKKSQEATTIGNTPLITYQNDYKPRLPGEMIQVCKEMNISVLITRKLK